MVTPHRSAVEHGLEVVARHVAGERCIYRPYGGPPGIEFHAVIDRNVLLIGQDQTTRIATVLHLSASELPLPHGVSEGRDLVDVPLRVDEPLTRCRVVGVTEHTGSGDWSLEVSP